jgi:NAD(P)-dependent dehydrogenase (short-subunit alcohol dehydrogenase family)
VSELRFEGRVAIVTGAGRGLGYAYAALLAALGASVVVNDLDADMASSVAASLRGAIACPADVASEYGGALVVRTALDQFGRIDAIVANAGTSWHRAFGDLAAQELTDVLGPSLFGTFHVVRAAWPHLVTQGFGRIVTTASGAIFGIAGRAHYAAAKGAVLALTTTLAVEGAPHGVSANCVLPWGLTRLARPGSEAPDAALAAPPVVWLCHETCPENGAAFAIGGGRVARVHFDLGSSKVTRDATPEAYREVLALDTQVGRRPPRPPPG